MAFATISVSNGVEIKQAPIGFSWTTFLFGGWPAIFRQDWLMGAVILVLGLLTWGIAGMVFAFFYNKIYLKSLFEKGYYIHALPDNVTEDQIKAFTGYITLPSKK